MALNTTVALGTTTLNTTGLLPCERDFETDGVTTGMDIAIGYGIAHGIVVIVLAIQIYWESRQKGDKISLKSFLHNLWKERGIYTPLLIHIYDTATDLGVLYEWHQLAQFEKNCKNLESLDMHQFFWTALGFMIAYRSLLGLAGAAAFLYGFVSKIDDWCDCDCKVIDKCFNCMESMGDKCCLCYIPLYLLVFTVYLIIFLVIVALGFAFGALELMIFAGIYYDFKEKKDSADPKRGAGMGQKVCQSTEGILESLPEVIMQSVFIMRAANDETLDKAAGAIKELVFFSIVASLLSITSKYIWIDEIAVSESSKSMIIKKEDFDASDPDEDAKSLVGTCLCFKSYYISYGFIVRMVWRLSAVTARFVIFALIWVVLGGWFEMVMIPTMMVLWYIGIFSYAFCGECSLVTSQIHTGFKKLKRSERILNLDEDFKQSVCGVNWFVDCVAIVMFILAASFVGGGILLVLFLTGIVFQLGIAVITGKAIYFMRTVENCFLMILISIFALAKFDCEYCADAEQRTVLHVFEEDKKKRKGIRIALWLVSGWIAVIIHMIMTIKMNKVIDKGYDMDVGTIVKDIKEDLDERYQEYLKLQQRLIRTARVRGLMRKFTKEEIAGMIGNRLIPNCVDCEQKHDGRIFKLVPSKVQDAPGTGGGGASCKKCGGWVDPDDEEEIDVVWHCLEEDCKYRLCTDCGHIENTKDTILSTNTMMRTPTTLRFQQITHPKHLQSEEKEMELPEITEGKATMVEEEKIDKTAEALMVGEIQLGKLKSTEVKTEAVNGTNDDKEKADDNKSTETEPVEDDNNKEEEENEDKKEENNNDNEDNVNEAAGAGETE